MMGLAMMMIDPFRILILDQREMLAMAMVVEIPALLFGKIILVLLMKQLTLSLFLMVSLLLLFLLHRILFLRELMEIMTMQMRELQQMGEKPQGVSLVVGELEILSTILHLLEHATAIIVSMVDV